MQFDLRMMHVYGKSGQCIQDPFPQRRAHFHGFHGIALVDPAGKYLERLVLLRVLGFHVLHNLFCQIVKSPVLDMHHRTDADDAENGL